jgi:hypothetical protein
MKNIKYQISNIKSSESRQGVIAIATMLVLGAVVVQIGLVGFILSYYLNNANAGAKFSSYSYSGAESGITEGILRIMRNEYDLQTPAYFVISVGAGTTVTVIMCGKFTPPSEEVECNPPILNLGENKVQITSWAGTFNKQRIMVAIVEVDPITHAVRLESIIEKDQLSTIL